MFSFLLSAPTWRFDHIGCYTRTLSVRRFAARPQREACVKRNLPKFQALEGSKRATVSFLQEYCHSISNSSEKACFEVRKILMQAAKNIFLSNGPRSFLKQFLRAGKKYKSRNDYRKFLYRWLLNTVNWINGFLKCTHMFSSISALSRVCQPIRRLESLEESSCGFMCYWKASLSAGESSHLASNGRQTPQRAFHGLINQKWTLTITQKER